MAGRIETRLTYDRLVSFCLRNEGGGLVVFKTIRQARDHPKPLPRNGSGTDCRSKHDMEGII